MEGTGVYDRLREIDNTQNQLRQRGSVQYALDILARNFSVQPKGNPIPFNKSYNYQTYNNFNQYDILSLGSAIDAAEPLIYVFYGDLVIQSANDPLSAYDEDVETTIHKNLNDKSAGMIYQACGYSAGGGVGGVNVGNFYNCFVSYLNITNRTGGGGGSPNTKNTAKFEGWLIRIN